MTPEREKELKQEFAKAFGWYEYKQIGTYYADSKNVPKTPSWEEIFVEIGRMKQPLIYSVPDISIPTGIPKKIQDSIN